MSYYCLIDGSLLQPFEGPLLYKCSRKTCGGIYTTRFLELATLAVADLLVNWRDQLAELQGSVSN